nr:retinoic acid receptor RXR-beta-like [Macaca fascicularis]
MSWRRRGGTTASAGGAATTAERRPGREEPSRASRRARQSAQPASGATLAGRAPRSLLSPAPRPLSLRWRAEEAPKPPARPSPPPTALAAREAGVAFQRSEVGAFASPGESGGTQAGGCIPPVCSAGARAGSRSGAGGLAVLVQRSSCSPFLPQPLPGSGYRSPLRRRDPPRRLVGSYVVCGWARVLFFTGRADPDRPHSAEGPPVEWQQSSPACLRLVASVLPVSCVWREITGGSVRESFK